MKKRVNLLPNLVTAFGLCCGLFAIFKMNMIDAGQVNQEVLTITTFLLLLAAFADLLDGALARAMKVESDFGGFFDCMADAVNFGVAPSVIVLKTISASAGTELSYLITAAAMVFSACGVLRLVRFSVTSQQAAENISLLEAHRKNFTGLPIPAAAAALISANLFLVSDGLKEVIQIRHEAHVWILFSLMIILGYFMISRWKFLSLKTLHIKIKSFQQVFFLVLFAVFVVFYGLIQHFSLVFLVVSWSYLIIAWILSIIRVISGKKSKRLEDFEPADEELE